MLFITDEEKILTKLSEKGNPLERLDHSIDWEMFRPLLNELFENKKKDPSKGGRPPLDFMMMFKTLLLQRLHNLSDDAMEYQLLDRTSFRQFVGCTDLNVPDAKSIWVYKEKLTKSGRESELFDLFYQTLTDEGLIAHEGQIVDASFVEVPKQRNTREENDIIKETNDAPELWSENKKRQKDTDAKWTRKGNQNYFGYKNHVSIDSQSKFIKYFIGTPANVHDSQVYGAITDEDEVIYADSAYIGQEAPKGCEQRIVKRAFRNKPLTEEDKMLNKVYSKIRCRVEHVFGFIENSMKGSTFNGTTFERLKTNLTLTNLLYNMCRYEQVKRLDLATWL